MLRAEVIGSPIAHSRSPQIHGAWIEALRLNAHYGATEVLPENLRDWLERRRADEMWRGCSVTAPLKVTAVAHVDFTSDEARRVGALNLICREGPKLIGHNTDVEGLRLALAGKVSASNRAVIIGAGGAARSALVFAADQGFHDICIVARSPERIFAPPLRGLSTPFRVLPFRRADAAIAGADLIVNATPTGSREGTPMPRKVLDALRRAARGAAVLDMVYDPVETRLLEEAKARGLIPVPGLALLEGQARPAFEILFGQAPPEEPSITTPRRARSRAARGTRAQSCAGPVHGREEAE